MLDSVPNPVETVRSLTSILYGTASHDNIKILFDNLYITVVRYAATTEGLFERSWLKSAN